MGYPSGGSLATSIRSVEVAEDGSFALRGKTYTIVKALTANTEATLTVPTFPTLVPVATGPTETAGTTPATRAFFASNGDFWANYDITITAIPAADITDGTAPEFKPAVRLVSDVTTIHLMAPAACLVSILFFQG
jgi:hypothetical protein